MKIAALMKIVSVMIAFSFLLMLVPGGTDAISGGSTTEPDVVILETPEEVDVSYICFHPTDSSKCLMIGGSQYTNFDYGDYGDPDDDTYSYSFTNNIYTYDGVGAPAKVSGSSNYALTGMDWHPDGDQVTITGSKISYKTEKFTSGTYVYKDTWHPTAYEGGIFRYENGWPSMVKSTSDGYFTDIFWNHAGTDALILGYSMGTYNVPSDYTSYENMHEHYSVGAVWRYSGGSLMKVSSMREDVYPLSAAWSPDDSYALIVGSEFNWEQYYENQWDDDWDNDNDYQMWETTGAVLKYQGGGISLMYQNQYSALTGVSWQPGGDMVLITGYQTKFMEKSYDYEDQWGNPRTRSTSWLDQTSIVAKYDNSGIRRLNCPNQWTPLNCIDWRGGNIAIMSGNRYQEHIWYYDYDKDKDGYVDDDEQDDYEKAWDEREIFTPLLEYNLHTDRFEDYHFRFNDKSIHDIAFAPDGTYALLLGGDDTIIRYIPILEPPKMRDPLGKTAIIPELVFDQRHPEDGMDILDLSEYFTDENDADWLVYTIESQQSPGILEATLNDTNLCIIQHNPNWHGSLNFTIRATDNTSAYTISDVFKATVTPIPPVIISDPFGFNVFDPGSGCSLLDLEGYFNQPDDPYVLKYSIVYQENPSKLEAFLNGTALDFIIKDPQWSGSLGFSVRATYENGAYIDSNVFQVRVDPIPPLGLMVQNVNKFDEDCPSTGCSLVDLAKIFKTLESPELLVYTVEYQQRPDYIEAVVNGTTLDFIQKVENWYGTAQFSVRATYPNGAYIVSALFDVEVTPTNDPPEIPKIIALDEVASNAILSPGFNAELGEAKVKFTAIGSDLDDDGTNTDPLTYRWDFGDGGTAIGEVVTHTYKETGIYTVKLEVTDSSGVTRATTHEIEVSLAQDTWFWPVVIIIIIVIVVLILVMFLKARKRARKERISKVERKAMLNQAPVPQRPGPTPPPPPSAQYSPMRGAQRPPPPPPGGQRDPYDRGYDQGYPPQGPPSDYSQPGYLEDDTTYLPPAPPPEDLQYF